MTATLDRPAVDTADLLPRLLTGDSELAAHRARFGPLPLAPFTGTAGRRRLVEGIVHAGLRGRGGAGFPTGRKLATVAAGRKTPVVVANGCESEPASSKDRVLLRYAPHLVLDGAALAAHAVGADRVFLCVERGTGHGERLERHLDERRDDPVRWHVVPVPRRYVASEESALVHFLNDGEARPLASPPRPYERGVEDRPTLIDNVETLAHLALIAYHGPDWFRAVGTGSDPGSALVTVAGAVANPGVFEVAPGTSLGEMLDAAGGPTEPLGAALVGGYFGTWVPLPQAVHLPLSHDPTGPAGTTLGAGAIVALPAGSCGLAETSRVLGYLAAESANQCGPCHFGLPAVAEDMAAVIHGRADPGTRNRLRTRLGVIAGRGACKHPDGAIRLVASALDAFAADLDMHLAGYTCTGLRQHPVLPLPDPEDRDREWR
ncbi:NADH-ubiquinone oxidoreductase-F iron-sulfur binding region domain-containing protein [Rhizomonospora bruguierae]|uniref:NADH-ubiquinone oxidoreductase-F iron-sulfur binding region domain-containing protein n=1 Tax=Rhizomonospora bruguierae TaxID=1581705 RepID=UPI001BCEC6D5|nr:NADH-ubiquinone oxidoreductase-F iron-sulfur binding region domain-containing protein [Micromonospora sp. NBRC 107566]